MVNNLRWLDRFDPSKYRQLADATVDAITHLTIFHVYSGRNAWWSTWVEDYGLFFVGLSDATNFAESQRVQGSVFHIDDVPALALRTSAGVLLIAEMGTPTPLKKYSATALTVVPPSGAALIQGARNRYLCPGIRCGDLALSFERPSRFWQFPPDRGSRVVRLASENPDLGSGPSSEAALIRRTSYSTGGNYLLGWTDEPSKYDPGAVRLLADQASRD